MSGAMVYDIGASAKAIAAATSDRSSPEVVTARIARLGLSPRQQALNRAWGIYRCAQYDGYKTDWDGRPVTSDIDRDAIVSGTSIPPGFYDAGAQNVPLQYRRPTAPYQVGRIIVNRFTGLLFGRRHRPKLRMPGDAISEDFVTALAEASRLWPRFTVGRRYGGGMGSVAMGFQFVDGVPRVEVHDPRWCDPTFSDRENLVVSSLDKRYQYPMEQRNLDTGIWETVWFWYRRLITDREDTLFKPVPVGDGDEPKWEIDKTVQHGLGFCPIVWIQNTDNQDDIDGDPDFHGVEPLIRAVDALVAQANYGTLGNADPTLVLKTDLALAEIRKGSDNAIKLGKDGSADYLELQGIGAKAALDLADKLVGYALNVARCIVEEPNQGGAVATATEIERRYSSMFDAAEELQEQYGERGVKPLMEMMLKAVRGFSTPQKNDHGTLVVGEVTLPPRMEQSPDNPDQMVPVKRTLGSGGVFGLQWPEFAIPTPQDVLAKVQASAAAKAGSLIDGEHASQYVADAFQVKDVQAMIRKINTEAAQTQAAVEAMAMKGVTGVALGTVAKSGSIGAQPPPDDEQADDQPPPDAPPPPGPPRRPPPRVRE